MEPVGGSKGPGPSSGASGAGSSGHRRERRGVRRRFGWVANPAWQRALILLPRFPGLLVAVVGAAFVLAVAGAAQPLFISSASNQALRANLAGLCPWTVGLQVNTFQPITNAKAVNAFEQRDGAVEQAAQGVQGLGPKELTLLGTAVDTSLKGTPVHPLVRLMSRDGFPSHIQVVASAGGPGVWLPDDTAGLLKAKAGDTIGLSLGGHTVQTRVAGIYRSLSYLLPTQFWCSRTVEIYGLGPNAAPPGLALTDQQTVLQLSQQLHDNLVTTTWEYPVAGRNLTLEQARRLAGDLSGIELTFQNSYGAFLATNVRVTSLLGSAVDQTDQAIDQIRSPSSSVAVAGRLVAIVVLAAAGLYWLDRRRVEVGLLAARGVGPVGIASKAALETLLPIAVATAAGWYATIWLVRWLGPGSLLSGSAPREALVTAAWTALLGLVLMTAVVALTVRGRESASGAAAASVLSRMPWEIVILLLMGASLYEMLTRGGGPVGPQGEAHVDILLILFPILFVAGGAGLAARGLRRALPALRSTGDRRSPPVFLASRRMAAASGIALGLVTAVALAVGIFAYAGELSLSTKASTSAKASVFVGADVRSTLLSRDPLPKALATDATVVEVVDLAVTVPGQASVTVVGVDPATFARAAYWDSSFSNRSLPDLLQDLEAKGPDAPVLVAGGAIGPAGTIRLTRSAGEIRYRVADTVNAFPMQTQHETVVVMSKARLDATQPVSTPFLLGSGDPKVITDALTAANYPFMTTVTPQEVEASPSVVALSWLYAFLRALGILTGLIVLAALVLYLAARQRGRVVSYALARRMGLTGRQHRRSLTIEITAMLLVGFVLGAALAWLAAKLVFGKLDPLPALPPPALFRVPWPMFAATVVVLAVAAWLGARLVHRRAERADVSEVMRVAG